jgi:hypothetical protein
MALVVTVIRRGVLDDRKFTDATLTYTNATSYATGGIAIAASDLGLVTLDHVQVGGSAGGSARYDQVAGKMVLNVAAGTEVANAGDPTGFTVRVRGIGY